MTNAPPRISQSPSGLGNHVGEITAAVVGASFGIINHRAHNVSLPSKTVADIRVNEVEYESGVRSAADAILSRAISSGTPSARTVYSDTVY